MAAFFIRIKTLVRIGFLGMPADAKNGSGEFHGRWFVIPGFDDRGFFNLTALVRQKLQPSDRALRKPIFDEIGLKPNVHGCISL